MLGLLGGTPRSGRSIAKALGKSEPTVRRVLHDLGEQGLAHKATNGWVRHRVTPQGDDAPDAPCGDGSELS